MSKRWASEPLGEFVDLILKEIYFIPVKSIFFCVEILNLGLLAHCGSPPPPRENVQNWSAW